MREVCGVRSGVTRFEVSGALTIKRAPAPALPPSRQFRRSHPDCRCIAEDRSKAQSRQSWHRKIARLSSGRNVKGTRRPDQTPVPRSRRMEGDRSQPDTVNHSELSMTESLSAQSTIASMTGRRRQRRSSSAAGMPPDGSGRNSATGSPSKVTVSDSPLATRWRTRPPWLRRSRTETWFICGVYHR